MLLGFLSRRYTKWGMKRKGGHMKRKTKYFSMSMLKAFDARGQRQHQDRPSNTTVVHNEGYMEFLASKMEKYDPEGKESHALATKYRK